MNQLVLAARTKTGKDYEPSSLRGILASVERHLSRSSYGKTIFKDSDFKKRDALKGKQRQLKRHGLGNRPKVTTALTDDEIEILFDKKLLGLSSPQALLNTVWLNNMIHFGLRDVRIEQKELRWGDIVLKTDSDGKEYLECRQTKTRTGEDPRNQRPIKPRMYANNDAISIERIVIQCTFARCTKKMTTRGGLATACELATFRLSMIALVKKSVNHSRTVANMPRTGWEQQQQEVRVRSDSVK